MCSYPRVVYYWNTQTTCDSEGPFEYLWDSQRTFQRRQGVQWLHVEWQKADRRIGIPLRFFKNAPKRLWLYFFKDIYIGLQSSLCNTTLYEKRNVPRLVRVWMHFWFPSTTYISFSYSNSWFSVFFTHNIYLLDSFNLKIETCCKSTNTS
jgi:hypothetical protein